VPIYPVARKALFHLPAEMAHTAVVDGLGALPSAGRRILRASLSFSDPCLRTRFLGIDLENPVGVAAGLDKGGTAFNGFAAMGFGFVEVGTVTAHPQPGNPRPRLFRLPADRALLNRMGFNNPGAERVAARLARSPIETVLGINVGKSKVTPLDRAVEDYLHSIALLEPYARYLVINVSSPNTPGLRDLQDAGPLRALIRAIVARRTPAGAERVPALLKIAPDLTESQLDQAVDIAVEEGAAGIIAVNTTISREGLRSPPGQVARMGAGGISGRPLRSRAHEAVARIYRRTSGTFPIVGVGGIASADDAWERILAGASLVQLYTGLVYEGPGLAGRISRGLALRIREAGFRTVADAVGAAHR